MKNSFLTPLIVEVMPSGKIFRLHFAFTYQLGKMKITVPVGFDTDFASIPRFARMLIPKLGRYNKAAVIHDYLYQHHMIEKTYKLSYVFTRAEADAIFRDGMRDLGVAKWKYTLMYWAVRLGGFLAWRKRK